MASTRSAMLSSSAERPNEWLQATAEGEVLVMREETLTLPGVGAGDVPVSIWVPSGRARGVVLLGHGLGVDRYHDSVQKPTHLLTSAHQLAVIASDLPLHGVRKVDVSDPKDIVARWQAFWADGGVWVLQQEWTAILGCGQRRFPKLPCAYFGVSLGTQYGIVFLAATLNITAAVLGLFGSHPPPLTPVMNLYAPRVRCPVYFIQKQDDEIHPLETSKHLFSILGSATKTLDSSPGGHSAVSRTSLESACAFISKHV